MAFFGKKKTTPGVPATTPAASNAAPPSQVAQVDVIEGTTPVSVTRRWRRYNSVK